MILSAGLSPVWQQILVFDRLTSGEVNRAVEVQWCASGKSLNAARAVQALQGAGYTISTCGGRTGRELHDEFTRDQIPAHWIETTSATRICTTVIERQTGLVTELVENAPPLTTAELEQFEATFLALRSDARVITLSGSLPPVIDGPPPVALYQRLLQDGPAAILDGRGAELLAALPERPLLIKPNRAELAATCGHTLPDESAVLNAMRELNRAGAVWVLVTQGPGDVLLSSAGEAFRLSPPTGPVVNPIGCGDCLTGGVAVAIAEGAEMIDAARLGIGAAVDNLGELLPARLDRSRVEACAERVVVSRI